MLSKFMYLAWLGDVMNEETSYASRCKDCKKCEKHCPQHLPISDVLKDVVEELEVRWLRPVGRIARYVLALQRWRNIRRSNRIE